MKEVTFTTRFNRDWKRCRKRGYNRRDLEIVTDTLAKGIQLAPKHDPHKLVGNYVGCWGCHIRPDWVLIYKIEETEIILVRTGTHSDLYKK